MLLRHLLALTLLGCWTPALHAQNGEPVAQTGWQALPDSLIHLWHLDKDQIHRLGMIEEDYDAEKAKVMSDPKATKAKQEGRLRKLAQARRKEIEGIFTADQSDALRQWERATEAGSH